MIYHLLSYGFLFLLRRIVQIFESIDMYSDGSITIVFELRKFIRKEGNDLEMPLLQRHLILS